MFNSRNQSFRCAFLDSRGLLAMCSRHSCAFFWLFRKSAVTINSLKTLSSKAIAVFAWSSWSRENNLRWQKIGVLLWRDSHSSPMLPSIQFLPNISKILQIEFSGAMVDEIHQRINLRIKHSHFTKTETGQILGVLSANINSWKGALTLAVLSLLSSFRNAFKAAWHPFSAK